MDDIKRKAREMFDEKFGIPSDCEIRELNWVLQDFIDQIIDLAIADRDREIVERIEKDLNSYWRHPMALFPKNRTPQSELKEMKIKEDIINLINSKK